MSTMNISLPDSMKEFVEQQAAEKGYSTSSEYVRDLDPQEVQHRQQLRDLLMEGARVNTAGPQGRLVLRRVARARHQGGE